MYEYKVVNAHDFAVRPDEKRAQKEIDTLAKEGWRLVTSTAGVQAGGGRLLLYFEREVTKA